MFREIKLVKTPTADKVYLHVEHPAYSKVAGEILKLMHSSLPQVQHLGHSDDNKSFLLTIKKDTFASVFSYINSIEKISDEVEKLNPQNIKFFYAEVTKDLVVREIRYPL